MSVKTCFAEWGLCRRYLERGDGLTLSWTIEVAGFFLKSNTVEHCPFIWCILKFGGYQTSVWAAENYWWFERREGSHCGDEGRMRRWIQKWRRDCQRAAQPRRSKKEGGSWSSSLVTLPVSPCSPVQHLLHHLPQDLCTCHWPSVVCALEMPRVLSTLASPWAVVFACSLLSFFPSDGQWTVDQPLYDHLFRSSLLPLPDMVRCP